MGSINEMILYDEGSIVEEWIQLGSASLVLLLFFVPFVFSVGTKIPLGVFFRGNHLTFGFCG
jgi:hypothetical protein